MREAGANCSERKKTATPGIHAIWIRVAAGLLAAALVATLLLSNAIRIRIQRMEEANAAAAANNYLLENTEYVGLSAWERIQKVVRQMADQASLESHYEKASIAIAQGENETALYHINECLALVDESSEAYEELKMKQGCLLALLEDYEQAQTVFDEVLRRAPGNADAWLLQAQLLLQKGDVTAAMEHLRRYISCAEETADQLSVMAQLCYGAGEYADALIYGEQALAMAADDAAYGELFRCMGYAALLSGDDRAENTLPLRLSVWRTRIPNCSIIGACSVWRGKITKRLSWISTLRLALDMALRLHIITGVCAI